MSSERSEPTATATPQQPSPPIPSAESPSATPAATSTVVSSARSHEPHESFAMLAFGAIGVVYGDIGTSPLYALKECFHASHGVAPSPENVIGLLSLFFWSLTLVVVIKYINFVLLADNRGEGGMLSLLSLIVPRDQQLAAALTQRGILVGLGLIGSALLLADGMITPAISVLSAVEGLKLDAPKLGPWIIPITLAILIWLFIMQKRGTGFVGALFGPAMVVWFVMLMALGLPWIFREPIVLTAVNPLHAVSFFRANGMQGFLVLGAVVLCTTGAEALYADMGHFGRKPIRFAWFVLVFPALLINYFGQGALVIASRGQAAHNPFYELVHGWLHYPVVAVATMAAVIASQALISGAFSLAQQAVQMGYFPRLTIVHTSRKTKGQIYVPEINNWLMVACCGLVLAFGESSKLAAAYGISVIGTMMITTLLLFVVMRRLWNWSLAKALTITSLFLAIDLAFLGANIIKIKDGGWFPLAVALVGFTIMTTWKRGRALLWQSLAKVVLPLDKFLESLARGEKTIRVQGTAVFMTSNPNGTPVVLMHHFKHNKVLHERIILLAIETKEVPLVPSGDRVQVRDLGQGFFQVTASYGFMQNPRIKDIFRCCEHAGLQVDPSMTSFYLGRETLITTKKPGMRPWRKTLFTLLSRNAISAVRYFEIPPNRVVELGTQIEF